MDEIVISKWQLIGEFIRDRLKNPIAHPEFIGYLVFVVIGAGGFGIWRAWINQSNNDVFDHIDLAKSMLNFSITIVAAGCIELMFVKSNRLKNSLFMFSLILITLFCLSFFFASKFDNANIYWLTFPTTLLAIFIWWVGNGTNTNLTDDFFDDQSEETKRLTDIIKKKHEQANQ